MLSLSHRQSSVGVIIFSVRNCNAFTTEAQGGATVQDGNPDSWYLSVSEILLKPVQSIVPETTSSESAVAPSEKSSVRVTDDIRSIAIELFIQDSEILT